MMPVEKVYGIIIVFKDKNENKFLLLQNVDKNNKGSWSFPKGHVEDGESPKETALRELKEETGINKVKFIEAPLIHEEYKIKRKGIIFLKINEYFIGFVNDKKVKKQKEEVHNYKWATYEETLKTFLSFQKTRIIVLEQAQKYLEKY